jgi:predicted RNase H-like HicB family nuclease
MALKVYRAIVFQNPGDGPQDGWDAVFPDFPGCVSTGDTANEAIKNAVEALGLHVEGMVSEGLELPPESVSNMREPDWVMELPMQNALYAHLTIEAPGRSTRINITMDQALVERLDAAASREGTTRSGYLAQAVREKLQKQREPAA